MASQTISVLKSLYNSVVILKNAAQAVNNVNNPNGLSAQLAGAQVEAYEKVLNQIQALIVQLGPTAQ